MKLSIITATFNAAQDIPRLIESLRSQDDQDFEWVVSDGLSTDETLEIIGAVGDLNVNLISQPDFGVYDALNRGIKMSSGEYYLVVGADDYLFPCAVSEFKSALNTDIDIVTASVLVEKSMVQIRKMPAWLTGSFHYVNGHAVGTVFRKSLHEKYGFYSRRYPIAADKDFILRAVENGARVSIIDSVVGEFSLSGLSSKDTLGSLTETLRVNIDHGFNKYIQLCVFIARLFKNISKI